MPDDNYTISSLTALSTINNGDLIEISTEDQTSETGYASGKATMTQLADKLLKGIQFATDLETASKTIIGGINSLLANMTTPYDDLSFPIAEGVCCSYEGLVYQSNQTIPTSEVWTPAHWTQVVLTDLIGSGGGGSGGHTILDNSGTALTQRTNLQFKGAYSEDNSGDDTTEINVVRSMTKAQYDQLSADEKVGIINVTDEKVTATNIPISGNDSTDTKAYIDTGLSGKQDKYWKQISSYFELTGNNTGTWSFTDDLSTAKYTDIMFCISLVNYDNGVRSSMSLSRLGFEAYGVFYDYTVGSDRMYFQLSKATNNSFTVSGTNLGSISSRVFVTAYYR